MNWQTLLCLGDSITIASRSYLGYPEVAGALLGKILGNSWHVINHATCGFTAIDLARSIDKDFSHYQGMNPGIVTVMIGTNDTKGPTPLEDFIIAYEQVVVKAKLMAVGGNVVLIEIPPIYKNALYPYSVKNELSKYNKAISVLAQKYNCRMIKPNYRESDFFDGVHLNDAGVKHIGKEIANLILKDKGFESITDK